MLRLIGLALLCVAAPGCLFSLSSSRFGDTAPTPLSIEAASLSRCQGEADRTLLLTTNDSTTLAAGYVAVIVAADGQSVAAEVSGGAGMIGVGWPQTLAAGVYGVVVTRTEDASQARLDAALTLKPGPRLTAVSQGSMSCRASAADTASVVVTGVDLGSTTARVVSAAATVEVSALAATDGSSLALTLPSNMADGAYQVVVRGAAGCEASLDNAIILGSAPAAFTLASITPRLSDATIPAYATVHMRLSAASGSTLAATAQVFLGQAEASNVTATPLGLDVVFAQGSVAATASSVPVRVKLGACERQVDLGAALVGVPTGLQVFGTEPSAVDAVNGFVVDVRGSFTSVADELSATADFVLSADLDPDPFTESWQPLHFFYGLGPKNASDQERLRFALATALSVSAPYAAPVRISAGGSELFVDGFLQLRPTASSLAAPVARTLHKSRDWVHAQTATEHVDVWGCHLDAPGVSFRLVSEATSAVTALTRSAPDGANLYASRFACLDAAAAPRAASYARLTLSAALPAGIYRLQVVTAAAGADASDSVYEDPYPLVAYSAAPTLGAFTSVGALSQPRRNPQTAVALDALGRKYVYVVGGDSVDKTIDPVDLGAAPAPWQDYDYTPAQRDHTLKPFPLASTTLTLPSGDKSTFGFALVADGTALYALGGTEKGTDATTTDAIRIASVSDPTAASTTHFGSLSDFTNDTHTLAGAGNQKRFGLSATLIPPIAPGDPSQIIATGGAQGATSVTGRDGTQNIFALTLAPTGPVSSSAGAAGSSGLSQKQSFHQTLLVSAPSGPQRLWSFAGISDQFDGIPSAATGPVLLYEGVDQATPPFPLSSPTATAFTPSGLQRFGFGTVVAGERLFLLGGVYLHFLNPIYTANAVDEVQFLSTHAGDALSPTAEGMAVLDRRRGLFGVAHLPPSIYIYGGVVCGSATIPCGDASINPDSNVSNAALNP